MGRPAGRLAEASGQPAPVAGEPTEPNQLALRLFARVRTFRGIPPERALWRELLELSLGRHASFKVGRRSVSAKAVWALGAAIYFRANDAGVLPEDCGIRELSTDCRWDERTTITAAAVLREFHIIRQKRYSRRKPPRTCMNVGGLDWPTVRRRMHADRAQGVLPLDASGDTLSLLSGDTVSPPKGYREDQRDPPYNVAATTPDREQQQHRRFDGLIAYIASRHRELRGKYRRAGRPAPDPWPEDSARAEFAILSSDEDRRERLEALQEFADVLRDGIIPGEVAPVCENRDQQ